MQIKVIGVGKIKEKYLRDGIQEYCKRLGAYCKLEIVEVDDERTKENASAAEMEQVKEKEQERIMRQIKQDTYLIVLDIAGELLSSEILAQKLDRLALTGKSDLTFVIGGSLGVGQDVIRRADFRLSFSKMTFPHQLIRLILLEQIYRTFRINRGEPYHK